MYREQYGEYVCCCKSLLKGLKPREGGSNTLLILYTPTPLPVGSSKQMAKWLKRMYFFVYSKWWIIMTVSMAFSSSHQRWYYTSFPFVSLSFAGLCGLTKWFIILKFLSRWLHCCTSTSSVVAKSFLYFFWWKRKMLIACMQARWINR